MAASSSDPDGTLIVSGGGAGLVAGAGAGGVVAATGGVSTGGVEGTGTGTGALAAGGGAGGGGSGTGTTGDGTGTGGCAAGSGIAGRTGGTTAGRGRAAAVFSRALASAFAGFAGLGSLTVGLLATGVTGAGSAVAGDGVAGIGAGVATTGGGDAGVAVPGCVGSAACAGGVEAVSVTEPRERIHGMATTTIASTAKTAATAGHNHAGRLDAGATGETADLAADTRAALTETRLMLPWTEPESTSRRTRRRSAWRSAAC
jgi:hypothetical protein